MKQKLIEIFKNIPLRISITDHCNLRCFFCSNEGMDKEMKNSSVVNLGNLGYLFEILKKNGLEQISLTGGDPTCYPELIQLIKIINKLNFKKTFFHTNGIALTEEIIKGELKKFSKIAVSIHTLNFDEWKKMTNGNKFQFDRIFDNLELLNKEGYSGKVEIKIIPIKGYNFSKESIEKVLDYCNEMGFKFKFLTFEPIEKNHKELVVDIKEVALLLKSLGAKEIENNPTFRGQKGYLPINRYRYHSIEGVLIEIGCGKKGICEHCANSNEIFLTPKLEIKPCHANPYLINIKEAIEKKDEGKILNSILKSRSFLRTMPGKNKQYWSQE
jgi:molybdenum cofactor biosynthesis enzyme MoaA